ncbi:MAG: hypothetical protein FWG69_00200 [Oscillospiraceae bacterium]|nr:hypothetical protein [Oscillospiraceae bacterium]
MKYEYKVVTQNLAPQQIKDAQKTKISHKNLSIKNDDPCISYGISVSDENGTVDTIMDIPLDLEYLEMLVQRCNELNLCVHHLRDVVEDCIKDI